MTIDKKEDDLKNNINNEEIQNRFKTLYQTLDNLENKLKDFPELTIKS